MLILCSGITGFQPAPAIDKNQFKQICYSTFGNQVSDFIANDKEKSFSECIIIMNDRTVHILLNNQYPLIAFTSARDIKEQFLPFIEKQVFLKVFNQYYKVLSPDQLNEPLIYTQKGKKIIVKNENSLHQAELEQLLYWNPKTVGEVVFNYWD